MDADEVIAALREELKRTQPKIPDDIPSASDFRIDWHLDSLDLVEFVSRVEARFELQIPDQDLEHFVSLDATAGYIRSRFERSIPPATPRRPEDSHDPGREASPGAPAIRGGRSTSAIPVVITGVGVRCPLGGSASEMWHRLLTGESAARHWDDLASEGHRIAHACRIDDLDCDPLRRGQTLAVGAAVLAVEQAAIELPENTGVFVGSTIGESVAFERAGEGQRLRLSDYSVRSFVLGIRRRFELAGAAESFGTACAAGNYALGAAASAVRRGRVPVAVAGGVEPFSRLAMVGFSRSRAMSHDACRPFDRHRSGMLLGEGAAIFIVERAEDALRRGASPLAEIVSLGLSGDAYHATAPEPSGRGMAMAMRAALELAGVSPMEVDWVNAHGSATRKSDAAESRALRAVFDGRMPIVSGSKGALGHALGAASAIECAICVEGLHSQTVPPTAGHEEPEKEMGVCCTREPVQRELRYVLNNGFAFGGVNSALLLRQWGQ
jgi:3-oxoacyl-[acyl-carrier-protein] synthase II